jgi:hypothetical protein
VQENLSDALSVGNRLVTITVQADLCSATAEIDEPNEPPGGISFAPARLQKSPFEGGVFLVQ